MKILAKLNRINLKQNRARTIVTIIGVALSIALILSVIGVATSFLNSWRLREIEEYGDYHIMYRDVPGNLVSIIEESNYFDIQYYSNHIEYIVLEDGTKDYYVAGLFPRNSYAPITDAAMLQRDGDHLYNVFVKYRNPHDYSHSEKMMARELKDAGMGEIETRTTLVATLDGCMPETTRILSWSQSVLAIGVLAIVSAFVIRNSFNISITERERQFGMLSSIGARPRQIRGMVYREAFSIGVVAIPVGIILGIITTLIVCAIVNKLDTYALGFSMSFFIPVSGYFLIAIIGAIIILLSAASPAIVASRVSPIAALRNENDIKIKAKKVRTLKLTQKIWGIGGVIAAKNLKRSRKKYHTTVVSIVLSVAIFIGVSTLISYGYKDIAFFIDDTGSNFMIFDGTKELYNNIIERFNIKEYAYFYESSPDLTNGVAPVKLMAISKDEFARFAKRAGYRGNDYANVAILRDYYMNYHSNGSVSFERGTDYKVGDKIDLAIYRLRPAINYQIEDSDLNFDEFDGAETATDENDDSEMKKIELEVTQITEEAPLGISKNTFSNKGVIYISEENEILKDASGIYFTIGDFHIADSGLGEQIGKYLDDNKNKLQYKDEFGNYADYYYFNAEIAYTSIRNILLTIEILSYGFIAIISLIGITNIFNTITTNVALRAKEFAVLKSIGMTEKEFSQMVRLESVMYITRALLIGLPIGLLMSYGMYKLFDAGGAGIGLIIPWHAVVISILAVVILVAGTMRYSMRQIGKQNIIETIRKESF